MRKKLMTAVLLVIIMTVITTSAFAVSFGFDTTVVKDTDRHWAEDTVSLMKKMSALKTYDGYVYPDAYITRSEFTALVTRTFNITQQERECTLSDITPATPYYSEICAGYNAGIIGGYTDGTFKPDNTITREQVMLILSRITDSVASETKSFSDISAGYEYIKELSKLCSDGIITGYEDRSFRPYLNITKAEASTMVLGAMKVYTSQSDKDTVVNFGKEYLEKYFDSIYSVSSMVRGAAQENADYVRYTYENAAGMGYTVKNSVSNITLVSCNIEGPVSTLEYSYHVVCEITGNANSRREYNGSSAIQITTAGGDIKVFSHDTSIKSDKKINLTWEVFSGAPSYATNGVTAVSPSCFTVDRTKETGNSSALVSPETTLYINSSLTDEYVNYAKSNGYDIWAMYKSDFTTDTATVFLNSAQMRMTACDFLEKQILKYGLAGINFDFENMYERDRGAYTNHVKEISTVAHALGCIVSVDTTYYLESSSTWSMCYDRDAIIKYADYLILMAYDQYANWSTSPGPVSGIDWTEKIINLTLNEVPSEKFILGIPFYTRYWESKNGKVTSVKALSMSQAMDIINKNQAKGEYDSKYKLTKYSWENDNTTCTIWTEDAESIAQRINLVKKYGLQGVASWRRGFETIDMWSVIEQNLYN